MDLKEIQRRIEEIESNKRDDQRAHSEEDRLREDFIVFIAENGNKKLSEMAREIMKTNDIDFARWCA
jgi:hypothetical protein